MSKLVLIFKNALKTLFSNKRRLMLSSLGIALSAFLFIFLQLVVHLPQHITFSNYQNFPKDTILINGDFDYNNLAKLNDKNYKYTYVTNPIEFAIENRANVKLINY